jgi:hypothetical protein
MRIESPVVLIFQDEAKNNCFVLHPPADWNHEVYGLLVADLVRHIGKHFEVDEREVWRWVDLERARPTTTVGGEDITAAELQKRMARAANRAN